MKKGACRSRSLWLRVATNPLAEPLSPGGAARQLVDLVETAEMRAGHAVGFRSFRWAVEKQSARMDGCREQEDTMSVQGGRRRSSNSLIQCSRGT